MHFLSSYLLLLIGLVPAILTTPVVPIEDDVFPPPGFVLTEPRFEVEIRPGEHIILNGTVQKVWNEILLLNPNYETDFAPQLAKRRAFFEATEIASIASPAGPAVRPLSNTFTTFDKRQKEDKGDYSRIGCHGCPKPPDWMLCMHKGYEYGFEWPEQNKPAEGDGDWSECLCHRYQADIPYTKRNIDYLMKVPGPATILAGECQRVACQHNSGISWCNLGNSSWTTPTGFSWIAHAANALLYNCDSVWDYGEWWSIGGTRHHPGVQVDVIVKNVGLPLQRPKRYQTRSLHRMAIAT
ncbi:hypothetical protein MCOR25_006094 [Pyricularia grisea]|nr:hypothetical protein MCOR25_006094 [Pyricularia grisea]